MSGTSFSRAFITRFLISWSTLGLLEQYPNFGPYVNWDADFDFSFPNYFNPNVPFFFVGTMDLINPITRPNIFENLIFIKLLILIKLKPVKSIIIRRTRSQIKIHSRKILGPLSLAYALRNIIDRKALSHTNNNPFSLPFSSPTYFLYFVGATSTNSLMIKLQPKIYDYIMLIVCISFIPLINRRLFFKSEILRLWLLKNKSLGIVI